MRRKRLTLEQDCGTAQIQIDYSCGEVRKISFPEEISNLSDVDKCRILEYLAYSLGIQKKVKINSL